VKWQAKKEKARLKLVEAELYLGQLENATDKTDSGYEKKLQRARAEVERIDKEYKSYSGHAPARRPKTPRFSPDRD
jgi:hypothetical protein